MVHRKRSFRRLQRKGPKKHLDAMLVAHPDFLTGEVHATVQTGWQTVNVAYRQLLWQQCERRFDRLAGYRYASSGDGPLSASALPSPR